MTHVIYILQNNCKFLIISCIFVSEVITNISCFVFGVICMSAGSLSCLHAVFIVTSVSLWFSSCYFRLTLHYKSKCVMTLNLSTKFVKTLHLQLQGLCPLGSFWSVNLFIGLPAFLFPCALQVKFSSGYDVFQHVPTI